MDNVDRRVYYKFWFWFILQIVHGVTSPIFVFICDLRKKKKNSNKGTFKSKVLKQYNVLHYCVKGCEHQVIQLLHPLCLS